MLKMTPTPNNETWEINTEPTNNGVLTTIVCPQVMAIIANGRQVYHFNTTQKALQHIADYFHDLAINAKVPDDPDDLNSLETGEPEA